MWLALIPAASSSSSLVPEPGISLTARWVTASSGVPASASRTADPRPPSGWWSSAITIRPRVAAAAAVRVGASTGLTEGRRAGGVAGIQHRGAVDGAHHGQVLQRHLRRAVSADLHPRVRADQADAGPGD